MSNEKDWATKYKLHAQNSTKCCSNNNNVNWALPFGGVQVQFCFPRYSLPFRHVQHGEQLA